ncbi:DUF6177 family protein [Paenarthrobacter sp. NPDC057355]|uniref:DUF6177 family protein n=1 Tax=Paenarthrobacter sp. NPDC057355 TaxID=3346105 RepID=UPI00363F76B4
MGIMTSLPLVPVMTPVGRPWLSATLRRDLQQAALETAGEGILALQTPADAIASYPLVAFLKAAGLPWVVEGPDGAMLDAFGASGAPRPSPAVVIYGSVLHAAASDLVLGAFTSGMLAAAGCTPEFMGHTEPLQEPWNPELLTAGLRGKMPLAIGLLSGNGFAGVLSAYRSEAGVVESFDVLVAAHPGTSHAGRARLEAAAVDANAQEFGIDLHFGAAGLSIPVGGDGFRVPQLLVLGPALHQGKANGHGGAETEILGTSPFQHLAIRYPESSSWDGGKARRLQHRALGPASSG